ncbi:gliolectin [Drosophila rhopaloa]|uniref:Gliolectin n=2 Tax=Drosophila rhopaloa TaxID=1041015 RepID=A0ABM5I7Z8_DRORH|nr:gliolectin [Drosophila rhopaloa]
MAILCQPISLTLQLAPIVPRPPPSASEKKRIRRNLFGSTPGDPEIDQLLAQTQCADRMCVKERYGFDILLVEQRERAQDDALRGMRYPTSRATPSADADDECNPKASQVARGVALTAPEISASAQLILQKCTHNNKGSDNSADLANSTRHGQKPYAFQPLVKSTYRVRKAINKGILKHGKNSYISNNNNNNNNNVDNGTSELEDKEQ